MTYGTLMAVHASKLSNEELITWAHKNSIYIENINSKKELEKIRKKFISIELSKLPIFLRIEEEKRKHPKSSIPQEKLFFETDEFEYTLKTFLGKVKNGICPYCGGPIIKKGKYIDCHNFTNKEIECKFWILDKEIQELEKLII